MAERSEGLDLRDYAPRAMLEVKQTRIDCPRFPVIDAHNHLGKCVLGDWDAFPFRDPAELTALMDEMHIETIVDLDGGFGGRLDNELRHYGSMIPERVVVFAGLDYGNFATDPDFGETEAARLRASVATGARGLKVWKPLGLTLRDTQGRLIPINDERLDVLWQTAAELNVPVLIHIADPAAFFHPVDRFNERWEELHDHPDWIFTPTREYGDLTSPHFPSFQELMDQFEDMVVRNAATTFIGAHVGCYAENLAWVGALMDKAPNFHADISERIAELGRQPYTARRFFLEHPNQILFGTDQSPDREKYRTYFRFLETDDEYFNYAGEIPHTGRWQIYGLHLPDDVLRKVYRDNAARVLGLRR